MFAPPLRVFLCAGLVALLCLAALPLSAHPYARSGQAGPGIPDWFVEHLESRMHGGGRWVADNQAYVSDSEPIDAYGIEWHWGAGRKSVRGRMFAMADGRETTTIWELRTVWHPGERRALIYQYGSDGTFATGTLEPEGEGVTIEQEFHAPDGTALMIRHHEQADEHGALVSSTSILGDEGWQADRTYVWLPRGD